MHVDEYDFYRSYRSYDITLHPNDIGRPELIALQTRAAEQFDRLDPEALDTLVKSLELTVATGDDVVKE
jgi:hypothetical protein